MCSRILHETSLVTAPPPRPKIFHITHVDNLRSIVADQELLSDVVMITRGGPPAGIGMSTIKQRRLALPVTCHPNDRVGDYVPFYFCPRSIMLFVIHCANNPELAYRSGQGPIVHLQADLHAVIAWARQNRRRWAFSLSNAGARYATFRANPVELDQLDWTAIASTDFRSPVLKEAKQAELLVHGSFPWFLVEDLGVISDVVRGQAEAAIAGSPHRPPVTVRPKWYY
ncbi:MAG: DUF4433 domain-containing protein [Myxococcales bacterium]|nr:DUF4433 domain-containing protein [Myxococcales bacterium]